MGSKPRCHGDMENMNAQPADTEIARIQIRQQIENWVLYRDSGDWDRLAGIWHHDGWMTTTWFEGPFGQFIELSKRSADRGVLVSHFLGGGTCDIERDRAIAQTKMKIERRGQIHGATVDVSCTGRFFDFLERREGRWAIVRRQPIYEWDRLDVLDPSTWVSLDQELLQSFPPGYQHLAYLQRQLGQTVLHGLQA